MSVAWRTTSSHCPRSAAYRSVALMRLHIFIITIHFTEFTGTCDRCDRRKRCDVIDVRLLLWYNKFAMNWFTE